MLYAFPSAGNPRSERHIVKREREEQYSSSEKYTQTRDLGKRTGGIPGYSSAGIYTGLQEQASNHLKLLWSRAMVVSVEEKAKRDFVR